MRYLSFVVAIGAFTFAPRAAACGGGLVTEQGSLVTQQSQMALMSVHTPEGDGGFVSTDIAVLLNVPSAEQDFGVLIPLPASGPPTIDAEPIDGAAFTVLEAGTRPLFTQELSGGGGGGCGGCGYPGDQVGAGAEDNSRGVVAGPTVDVGPVTAQYLLADDATALTAYLDDNGFALPDGGAEVVAAYIAQGNGFLAFKRSTVEASSEPVSVGVHFTVEGDLRSVAFRMVSFGAPEVLPITLFIAADEPVGGETPWTTIAVEDLDDDAAIADYAGLVDTLTAENDGKLFILESLGDKARFEDPTALLALVDDGAVISRLSARIPRAALDADASFKAEAPLPNTAAAAAAFRMPRNVDAAAIVLVAITLVMRRRRRS